ncbi:MAG TPA: acyltransferase [Mucilaginibacter sp.]|nr:acyltransferase [Mucilaginibacter sp.]
MLSASNAVVNKPKIAAIENLRGIAALIVCIFHMTAYQHLLVADNLVKKLSLYGYLGVQIFFVISGFVIPWSLYNGNYKIKNFFSYLSKRFLRIEPPYVVSILLLLVLNFLSAKSKLYTGHPFHVDILQFLSHLIYLPEHLGFVWYQPVYFTLLVEFEFYILLGLIFPLIILKKSWMTWSLVLVLLLGSYLSSVELCGVIDVFLIGIIYFKYKIGHLKAYEFGAIEALIILFSAFNNPDINVAIIEVLALIGVLFWNRSNRITQFLGKISYSLYLIHIPIGGRVINLGERFSHTLGISYLVLALSIVASIIFAWIFYKLVELQALKLSRQLIKRF